MDEKQHLVPSYLFAKSGTTTAATPPLHGPKPAAFEALKMREQLARTKARAMHATNGAQPCVARVVEHDAPENAPIPKWCRSLIEQARSPLLELGPGVPNWMPQHLAHDTAELHAHGSEQKYIVFLLLL